MIDPVELTRDLIRRPSVTPADAGAMDVLQRALAGLGFTCRRMKFGDIENLYARYGAARPNLCFAGHTDVVPVGDEAAWTQDPFAAQIKDGVLIGRGAVPARRSSASPATPTWCPRGRCPNGIPIPSCPPSAMAASTAGGRRT